MLNQQRPSRRMDARNSAVFILFILTLLPACSSPGKVLQKNEIVEDYSNPEKTLRTFFKAGVNRNSAVVAKCFYNWDKVVDKSTGYRTFIEHIWFETQNINFRVFSVGRKNGLLELGIELINQKPYFLRREFYYFDYLSGRWLIVTSGWMQALGCG